VMVKGYDFRTEQFQVETVFTVQQPRSVPELVIVGAPAATPKAQFA